MHRKHYSEEEKNAVMSRYAAGGEEVKTILAEYGIPKSTFNQWLREYELRYLVQYVHNDLDNHIFQQLLFRIFFKALYCLLYSRCLCLYLSR